MNGMVLTPRASLAWQHAFGDVTPTAALAFESAGIGFTVAGVPIARDAALLDAGFDLPVAPRATLGIAYSGQLAANAQDNAVKGNFTWKFQ
jgi:outer membrane autotransporter protein